MELVIPLAKSHLNLLDPFHSPVKYGILGASLGGLMSLYIALRIPQIFGNVISQSGAFSFGRHDTIVYDLVGCKEPNSFRVWMDCGSFESLRETNRRIYSLLVEKGYSVEYREYSGGHNYSSWRNDLWRALEALYGRSA